MIATTPPSNPLGSRKALAIIWGLIAFSITYRIIASHSGQLSNTSPTMALCFGGGLLLGRKFWWAPALLIVFSDWMIGLSHGGQGGIGSYTFLTALLFCGAAWLGSRASQWSGKSWPTMWAGVLISSLVFYVATNTFAWAVFPGYSKSIAGWIQCQTTGLAGYPPSWTFLRNAIIADSIWCVIAGILFFFRFSPGREAVAEFDEDEVIV